MSPKRDSNTRPAAYEADALPTELLRHTSSSISFPIKIVFLFRNESCESCENPHYSSTKWKYGMNVCCEYV